MTKPGFETWNKRPTANIWEKRIHNFDVKVVEEPLRFEVTLERSDFPTLSFHTIRSDFAAKKAELIAKLLSARDFPGDFPD